MNTENYRKLKIVQMILISIAIILNAIILINQITTSADLFNILLSLCAIATLFFGAIYLIFDNKKQIAGFYKGFVAAYLISLLIRIISSFVNGITLIPAICSVISVVALVALEFIKDLGQDNTSKIYAVLFISEIIIALQALFATDIGNITKAISGILILGTFGLMVNFKYLDKKARGSK